jgi:hypothetical protein
MEKYYADGYRLQMGLTDVDLLFTRRGDEQVVVTLSVALAKTLTCKLAAQPRLTTSSHGEERAEQAFAETPRRHLFPTAPSTPTAAVGCGGTSTGRVCVSLPRRPTWRGGNKPTTSAWPGTEPPKPPTGLSTPRWVISLWKGRQT